MRIDFIVFVWSFVIQKIRPSINRQQFYLDGERGTHGNAYLPRIYQLHIVTIDESFFEFITDYQELDSFIFDTIFIFEIGFCRE